MKIKQILFFLENIFFGFNITIKTLKKYCMIIS